jgi:hypothetical protein
MTVHVIDVISNPEINWNPVKTELNKVQEIMLK